MLQTFTDSVCSREILDIIFKAYTAFILFGSISSYHASLLTYAVVPSTKRASNEGIGPCFGCFFHTSCSLNSQIPELRYAVGKDSYYTFCLHTPTKMFGLDKLLALLQDKCSLTGRQFTLLIRSIKFVRCP